MGKNVTISTLPNIGQNYLPKINTSNIFANSLVYDDGSSVLINTTTASAFKLDVNGSIRATSGTLTGALSGTSATFSGTVGIGGSPTTNYPLTLRSLSGDYTKIMDWGTSVGGSWGTMTINTSAPYNTIFTCSGGFTFTGAATFSSSVTATNALINTTTFGKGAKLEIVQNSSNTNAIDLKNTDATYSHIGTFSNNLYITQNYYYAAGQNNDSATYGQAAIILGAGTTTTSAISFDLSDAGATSPSRKMTILSSGNVGIGTSPDGSDWNASATLLHIYQNSTNGALLKLESSNAKGMMAVGNDQMQFGTISDDPLILYTNSAERMRITSGGYTKISNDGTYYGSTASNHEFRNTAVDNTLKITATNGSYTSTVVATSADRAATSAYSLYGGWSGNFGDKEFDLQGDGNGKCDGSWTGSGADYAEYFEWADGNINNEDRRGYSVSLVNNKIKIAEQGEKIIGVISGNPSIVGDAAWNKWNGKYLRDDYGSYILDNNGYRTLNPEYDENVEYIPREKRPEWSIVGLMGKLRLKKGQATMPNWIKMRDVSDDVEEWLVK